MGTRERIGSMKLMNQGMGDLEAIVVWFLKECLFEKLEVREKVTYYPS